MMGVSSLPGGQPKADATVAAQGWNTLTRELDAWVKAGRTATFWWRDDDAIAVTPALERLLDLSGRHGIPVALAVIPHRAETALFTRLAKHTNVRVLQHGYDHANHAPAGAKKCELGPHRPRAAVLTELAEGRTKLKKAAPPGLLLDVMVPPWNRIDRRVAAGLAGLGFTAMSADKPRKALRDAAGLLRANSHVDTIDWACRRFAGEETVLGAVVKHLSARRLGKADGDEPTGLLTHHLAQDDDGWRFIDRFFGATARHSAASWLDARRIFGPAS